METLSALISWHSPQKALGFLVLFNLGYLFWTLTGTSVLTVLGTSLAALVLCRKIYFTLTATDAFSDDPTQYADTVKGLYEAAYEQPNKALSAVKCYVQTGKAPYLALILMFGI